MLKPIVKENGLTPREAHLARLANDTFLGLWSFPNVWRDEGLQQNGTGKEVADLLVCFENTIIIFSDKDIAFKPHDDVKVSWGRWYRSSVTDSAKQLWGAEAHIRRFPERLFLDKKCETQLPHDFDSKRLKIHLVAVTFNSYSPAKNYFDSFKPGSSGSLLCNFRYPANEIKDHPFNVTDLDPKKTFVHVLDEMTLDLLLTELATASDFIHYLQCKEKAIRKKNLGFAGGEEDILAFYLLERSAKNNGFGNISLIDVGADCVFGIPESEWVDFRNSVDYLQHRELIRSGLGWANLVNNFSDCVLSAQVGEGQDLPFITHERVLRCFASENTASRATLAEQLVQKYESVPSHVRSSRGIASICVPDRYYIFLFLPRGPEEAYADYRKKRTRYMELYALVARFKYPEMKEIVVFATEPQGSDGSSQTVLAYDASQPLTREERSTAREVMIKEKILNKTTVTTTKAKTKAKRPPKQKPHTESGSKIGRNDPCLCGSGLKMKKCCALD